MAVHADDGAVDSRNVVADAADQGAILFGHRVAGGVGNVHHGRSGSDDGSDHFEEVGGVGASGVFGVELHLVDELASERDGVDRHLQDLALLFGERLAVAFIAELAIDVNVRCADSGVYAGPLALGQGFAAGFDVGRHGAGERADGGPLNLAANQLDGLEVFGRRVGIARLDDVHVQQRQLSGDGELLAAPQARSGGLFSVSQGSVEYGDFFRHGVVH